MEHEDLIKQLRKDMFTLNPPSEFRKEILACFADKTITDKSEAIQKIMNEHGYEKLTVDDLKKIFHFKASDEVIKPLPADPPVTKSSEETDPLIFDLSEFAAVYQVTSENPPCRELSIKEVSPGEHNEISFVSPKGDSSGKKTFQPKQEVDVATKEEWVTWSDGSTAYKVEFYSQFDKDVNKLLRRFRGWETKEGQKPLEFTGKEEPPNKDRGPSFWKQHGVECIIGGIVFIALAFDFYRKCAEAAEKKKDAAAQKEALDMQKAAQAQASAHVAETRAMAEAEVAQSFLESTSKAKRQALTDSIDVGLRQAFDDFKKDLKDSRKDGSLKFDFVGEDKTLRDNFDKAVKESVSNFVTANPKFPGSQSLQAMVDQKLYKAEDKKGRDERIRTEAISSVTLSMLDDDGYNKDIVEGYIEKMRCEYNIEMLNDGIAVLDVEITAAKGNVASLDKEIAILKAEHEKAKNLFEALDKTQDWADELQKLEKEIDARTKDRKTKEDEKEAAEKKKKKDTQKKDEADQDQKKAEGKKKQSEVDFHTHMKLAH
ncbi:hypothetical protein V8C35DRAFT_292442 [Trichoderma chlorosporum]